jgi:biotin synthase
LPENGLLDDVVSRILRGGEATSAEIIRLFASGAPEQIMRLAAAAVKVRRRYCGDRMELCSLVSARSGACPEDCGFCAQSARAKAAVPVYPLMSVEDIVKRAMALVETGADHICLVTSGRGPSPEDLTVVCGAAKRISETLPAAVCASLGLLADSQAKLLRNAGVVRYNHNLETAEKFFPRICTTHGWSERRATALAARRAGMQLCCGGIIGLGESPEDRVSLLFALKEIQPELVPLNVLNPRPGTALDRLVPMDPLQVILNVALFRLVLPRSTLKLAGGREASLRSLQSTALLAGANGMIVGGYLTTSGQELAQDLRMISDCGFELGEAAKTRLASSLSESAE